MPSMYFKNTKSISYNGKYRKTSPIRQTTSQQIFHSLVYICKKEKDRLVQRPITTRLHSAIIRGVESKPSIPHAAQDYAFVWDTCCHN